VWLGVAKGLLSKHVCLVTNSVCFGKVITKTDDTSSDFPGAVLLKTLSWLDRATCILAAKSLLLFKKVYE
jgi:hypothetical protein